MSTETPAAGLATETDGADASTARLLALGGVVVLTGSYVHVLGEVTAVVGGTRSLYGLVVAMVLAATLLARLIAPRTATVVAVIAAVVGFTYYLDAAGVGVGVVFSAGDALLSDFLTLVSGLALLRMIDAGTWALAFVPGPVFLSWYLAVRRQYAPAVVPGGLALVFLVLTGDASTAGTLLGVVGGVATVGFGELERRGGDVDGVDTLAVLVAAMIVLSMTVTVVPDGATDATPSGEGQGTLEGTVTAAPDRSAIAGTVELSPAARFTVESESPSYWRTGVYDRFTGDEWLRTGNAGPYEGPLEPPEGSHERVRQVVTLEGSADVMPAAPQPVAVDEGTAEYTEVDTHGQIRPADRLAEGDSYQVESVVVDPPPPELERAGTDYPREVTNRYLQTPEDRSSAFESRTAEITADAETPYEKAVAIETHLETSNEYSLEVERPEGDVAEAFLLEMDEGYCVYFATTMVQMLRAEDVPARYAVGYTTGEEVEDGEYLVRGLDAHAWVEVYFPDHGWVAFDPTPSDPREEVHGEQLQAAQPTDQGDVDADGADETPLPDAPDEDNDSTVEEPGADSTDPDNATAEENETDPATDDPGGEPTGSAADPGTDDPADGEGADDAEDGDGWNGPDVRTVVIGLASIVGLAVGVGRTGVPARVRREVRLRWQSTGDDPNADAVRAYRRLELLLERTYRPRASSESSREYLASLSAADGRVPVDGRVRRVGRYYERATYGDGVTRAEADDAVATVDELVREGSSIVGRVG